MFKFDFIDAAAAGYRFVIINHRAVYFMAIVPFLVKLASFVIITLMDMESNFLRQGLILLPSYFVEGWMISKLLRLAVMNEQWPYSLSGVMKQDIELYTKRISSLKAGMIVYVLIKMVLAASVGTALQSENIYQEAANAPPDSTSASFVVALAAVLLMVWAFRFLWLYIPAALGQSISKYLSDVKAFSSSFYLIGTWILSFMPVAVFLLVISQGLATIFGLEKGVEPSMLYTYIIVAIQAAFEIFTTIVVSIAMAFTIKNLREDS